jgi:uncharacterized protein YcbX
MKISHLYIHPVKSLAGISVQSFDIDRFGAHWDRRFMVVDEQGKFLTQRQLPAMVLIKTTLQHDRVTLSAEKGGTVQFSAADFDSAASIQVQVWRDHCSAKAAPAEINQWLSQQLGRPCRLVFMPASTTRLVDPEFVKAGDSSCVSFADGFPLLLTQSSSLADLNSRMSIDIDMQRLRPNFVVDGAPAWQEDQWKLIRIGEMLFDVVKPCSRCVIPTIDPATGQKQPEVFKTLQRYRQKNGKVYFGQNLLPRGVGTITVNDRVEVLE